MTFTLNDIDQSDDLDLWATFSGIQVCSWIMKFYSLDLNLDPMTLLLNLDLNIVKIYVYSKNEVPNFSVQKLQPEQTHRWTHRQTQV